MSAPTAARPRSIESAHWYDAKTGLPCHEQPKKDGTGMTPTTLAHARKLGLVPSVTNVLSEILRKRNLESWLIEQACLTVLTAPRKDGENLDEFVRRVLQDEEQHRAESQAAMDLGSEIHAAIAGMVAGAEIPPELNSYVLPVAVWMNDKQAKPVLIEKVVVGPGYAGTTDAVFEMPDKSWLVMDYKTATTLPKPVKVDGKLDDHRCEGWQEHELQLAAYANAIERSIEEAERPVIRTANFYISTSNPGEWRICYWPVWTEAYWAFLHVLCYWQWSKDYKP